MKSILQGVATINLFAENHAAAVEWYSKLLDTKPYFERPGYAEFRIGDYQTELGIIDRKYAPYLAFPDKPSGQRFYWHVEDVQATYKQLLADGATTVEDIEDRGAGFVTATVLDPFGNMLGVMYNPHYVEIKEKQ